MSTMRITKRGSGTVLLLIALLLTAVLAGCGSDTEATTTTATVTNTTGTTAETTTESTGGPATGTPYKIGLLTTLSGPVAFLGKDIADTSQMEVDKINAEGGVDGHPIELVVEDDGMDPGKAVAALTKLAQDKDVLAITGLTITALEPAVRPVAEREKVPFVILSPTLPDLRARGDKYVFNISANEMNNAYSIIQILKAKGVTKAVGITANAPLSVVTLDEIKKQAEAEGITFSILPDAIDTNAVDVTPQVTKLKELVEKEGAQVVVSTVWPTQVGSMVKTLRQLGSEVPVVTDAVAADNSFLAMGGDEINGISMPGVKTLVVDALADSDPQKPVVLAFRDRYQAKFNMIPGAMAAGAYDELQIIVNALKVSGPDRDKLRDALEQTTDYVGAIGVFSYTPTDHEGVAVGNFALLDIKNKAFELVK